MRGSQQADTTYIEELAFFRYRERFNLSYVDAINEPYDEVLRAIEIWELDAKRDKLEEKRRAQNH